MATLANIRDRLSDDAQYSGMSSLFRTVVFEYGAGIIEKFTQESYQPGETAKVELEVDIGDAEVYSQGDGLPIPLESTTKTAGFSFKAIRAVIRETGHARRARGPQNEGLRVQVADDEIMKCYRRIRDKIATTFDDPATYGVQGIISAGTYGFGSAAGLSLSRTTYAKLASYELNAAAPISTSLVNQAHYRAQDAPYGAAVDFYVAPAVQCQKYAELGSGKMLVLAGQGGPTDLVATELQIGGRPVYMLPYLTTTVILGFSGIATDWWLIWNEENAGRFHVLDLGADSSDTPMNIQVSTSLAIACTSPNKQVKIYGLTA